MEAEYELPNGVTVDSPAEAAARGFPIGCQAFVTCENTAAVTVPHPVLGGYPSCARCADTLS